MIAPYVNNMPGQFTYWAPGLPDGQGGESYGLPVLASCRWQRKTTMYRSASGELRVGNHVVYISQDVAEGGWLAEGDQTASPSPVPVFGKKILYVQKSPSLSYDRELIKVVL